jgi:putative phosphoesterase
VRVAALYDIHGMADALEAVLEEVESARVDTILLGGDIVGGPQPGEVLQRLRALGDNTIWIRGNGDRALGPEAEAAVADRATVEFIKTSLSSEDQAFLAGLPEQVTLEIDGLGPVLFCHATPRNDIEIVTTETPDDHLERILDGVEESTLVSGHTHMQFDRRIGEKRWVNAGSVGMPYEGKVEAFWALLGPEVEFRRTSFDAEGAAEAILASGWPEAEEFVDENVRAAVTREQVIPIFERIAKERGER